MEIPDPTPGKADSPRDVTRGTDGIGDVHPHGPEASDRDNPNNESRGGDSASLSRSPSPDITQTPSPAPDRESGREQRGRLVRWKAEREFARILEELPAGPELATRVVEWAGLGDSSESMMVEMIAALGRCIANLEGLRAQMVCSMVQAHSDSTVEIRSVCEEIALRIGHTHGRVARIVDLGIAMTETPALAQAMRQGHVGSAKAHQVLRDTNHLDPERRHQVITDVMNNDPQTRDLPALRRLTRTFTEWIDPEDATTKHVRVKANRSVWIDKAAHGMALLHAYLPAAHAYQIYATLTTMALAQDPSLATSPEATPHAPPPGNDGHTTPTRHDPGTMGTGNGSGMMPVAGDPGSGPGGPGQDRMSARCPGAMSISEGVAIEGTITQCPAVDSAGVEDLFPDEPVRDDEVPPEQDPSWTDIDIPWVEETWDNDPPAVIRAAEVTRTLGNRRADALVDLFSPSGPLTTGKPFDAVRPRLIVVARAEALLGSDQFPGELIGYGSLPAHAVRQIAQDATWQAIYQDPHTGRTAAVGTRLLPPGLTTSDSTPLPSCPDPTPPDILGPPAPSPTTSPTTSDPTPLPACPDPGAHLGVAGVAPPGPAWVFPPETWPAETLACHSYQPSPHIQNTVVLRDLTCSFTGCQRPAWACDLDHVAPYDPSLPAIDQTIASNLTPACRVHHRLKTLTGWDWTRDTHTGILTITSPQGRIYRIQPPTPTTPPWRNSPDW
ncbi:MAG: HNH endonuclease [Bifidobacteriaceae bacterium]|nr:HNH endonuclease [Bifidobacteriaceae bacterium]